MANEQVTHSHIMSLNVHQEKINDLKSRISQFQMEKQYTSNKDMTHSKQDIFHVHIGSGTSNTTSNCQ